MPPSRRRRTARSSKADLPPATSPTSVLLAEQYVAQSLQDNTRLQASFELDDFQEWWTTSSAEGNASIDSSIESLLHFPDESQATLKGICCDPDNANANVSPATNETRKRPSLDTTCRNPALGVNPCGKAISPRESHILSERQRRKGMNHLFSTLASLLPDSASKSDKSTIVAEIISYIQSLQGELENLSKRRGDAKSKPPPVPELRESGSPCSQQSNCAANAPTKKPAMQASLAPNVILSICGDDAFVTMSAASTVRNLLSRALAVLQQYELRLVDGSTSSSGCTTFHYFHVKIPNGLQFPKAELHKVLQNLAVGSVPSTQPV